METPKSLTIIAPDHPAHQQSVNPAVVYLASLGPGSRRAMRQALGVVAELLTGAKTDPLKIPWWNVQYQHSQAIRSLLLERYSPASANKIMAALRGVLREAWRLGFMDAEGYHRAIDIKTVKGNSIPKGRSVDAGEMISLVPASGTPFGSATPLHALGVHLMATPIFDSPPPRNTSSFGFPSENGKKNLTCR